MIAELVNQTADTFVDRAAWLQAKGFSSGEEALAINAGAIAYKQEIEGYFRRLREQQANQEKKDAH